MGNICSREPNTIHTKKKIIDSSKDPSFHNENTFFTNKSSQHNNINKNEGLSSIIRTKDYNNPTIQTVTNEKTLNQEVSVLKIIKKHNSHLEDQNLIDQCLLKHFFMRALEKDARNEIVKEMSLCFVQKNSLLFKQGSIGHYFYIIKTGQVQLSVNDVVIKTLSKGDNFGELALLHKSVRSGTIKALTDCYLWVLERKNFKKIVEHITQSQFEENKSFIETTPILSCLDLNEKILLASNLFKVSFEPKEYIVKEGEQADSLFIIKEGTVECSKNGNTFRTMTKGEHFGERGILIDSKRTVDVIAVSQVICYSISIGTFKVMLGDNFRQMLYLNFIKSAFHCSSYFNKFNNKLLEGKVFTLFTPINLQKNEVAFEKNFNVSDKIVVIIDGNLKYDNEDAVFAQRGNLLFEKELINNTEFKLQSNLVAFPDCLLIQANTKDVLDVFGNSFINLIAMSNIIENLQKVSLFKIITPKQLGEISKKIKIETFKKGDKVITKGEQGTKFYIVKKGKIDIFIDDNKYIRTIGQNDFLGERALLISEPRSATAIANNDVEVFYLDKQDFLLSIEDNMKKYLINRLFLQDNTISLEDLELMSPLGSGNYGTVTLVQSKKNKFLYAIKSITRQKVISEELQPNLELEKNILLQIDHPFIVKLVKTLKDSINIYFLMEYVKGKELFDVIRDIGLLNKIQTQFYTASMMLAVDYLHYNNVIYRDIKPENVIVCDNGYIKIIDFGTVKQIKERTSTVIGTPHYMAPEIILGEGYSFQVDFWSIAICMYEFICGFVPFGENAEDPMEIYLSIINEQLQFPDYCKDKKFRTLITQMLCKNPMSRLSKLSQIKVNSWFSGFDWESLSSLTMKPDVYPKLKENPLEQNSCIKKEPYTSYIKNIVSSEEEIIGVQKKDNEWFKKF